jgi:hypothetical protein
LGGALISATAPGGAPALAACLGGIVVGVLSILVVDTAYQLVLVVIDLARNVRAIRVELSNRPLGTEFVPERPTDRLD